MLLFTLLAATLFLAYANGANDNFKGVATLFGSRTTNYRKALWWATATTFAGSIAAVFLSGQLVQSFSGKGLVPDALVHEPRFLIAVACGAAFIKLKTHRMLSRLQGPPLLLVGKEGSQTGSGNR